MSVVDLFLIAGGIHVISFVASFASLMVILSNSLCCIGRVDFQVGRKVFSHPRQTWARTCVSVVFWGEMGRAEIVSASN